MARTVLEQETRRAGESEFMSSDDIVGKKVKNPEGYELGEIASLRVGLPTGRVAYAVLRTGGMFGLGAKLFAIPIEAMIYRPGDDVFVANISKHRIESASGFTEGEWPREADWDMIESTRPIGPPSQEEARAVTRTETPPREVVTTERVEVRERPAREEIRIQAEDVEAQPVTEAHAPELKSMMRAEMDEYEAEQLSTTDLQAYLREIDYPVGRGDLINRAREQNAPAGVIAALEQFSDRTYQSAAEVNDEFARVKQP